MIKTIHNINVFLPSFRLLKFINSRLFIFPILLVFTFLMIAENNVLSQNDWKKERIKCPVCGAENTFYVPQQYKPSLNDDVLFQYVLFPYSEYQSIYSCSNCKYTALIDDFYSLDTAYKNKISQISYTGFALGKIKNYLNINITERLMMAELTYQSMNKDDEFWCMFYRICAYHFDKEDFHNDTQIYRQKALDLSLKMLQNPYYSEGREKEFMFIAGSMFDKLGNVDSAYFYIREASLRNYAGNARKKENVTSKERLLTQIIVKYSALLRKDKLNKISKK